MGINVKNILIIIFFIYISFGTKGNVRTLEIGSLYYQCKPYQDVDFDFEKLYIDNRKVVYNNSMHYSWEESYKIFRKTLV